MRDERAGLKHVVALREAVAQGEGEYPKTRHSKRGIQNSATYFGTSAAGKMRRCVLRSAKIDALFAHLVRKEVASMRQRNIALKVQGVEQSRPL